MSDLHAESASPTMSPEAVRVGSSERANDGRTAVVVELFSSEGCSSCPRADEVLRGLDQDQPIREAQIIPLEFHVDYWNDLGWVDPFSKAEFSARQRGYAASHGTDSVFTPEAVVDGRGSTVGSRAGDVIDAVHRAAAEKHLKIDLTPAPSGGLSVALNETPDPKTQLFLAVTEAGLTTRVEAGENRGRTLEHAPIVRALSKLGPAEAGTRVVEVPRVEASSGKLSAVVFAQIEGGPIVGAAMAPLELPDAKRVR